MTRGLPTSESNAIESLSGGLTILIQSVCQLCVDPSLTSHKVSRMEDLLDVWSAGTVYDNVIQDIRLAEATCAVFLFLAATTYTPCH